MEHRLTCRNEHFTFHVQPGSSTISVALHGASTFRDPAERTRMTDDLCRTSLIRSRSCHRRSRPGCTSSPMTRLMKGCSGSLIRNNQIWHHLSASAHSADPAVQLSNGTGTLRLHLEWTAGGSGSDKAAFTGGGLLSRKRSVSSAMNADAVASSPGRLSGLRMSMARRDKDKERDGE